MHHARIPSPPLIHYKYREIVQASARDYGAFPVLGRAGAKTNSEATPLAFQFTESSSMIMRAVTRLAAIMIKKFVVRISCVSVARHKPWSERICSIAVYVIASVSKIAHCVCVEGGIVHDLAICHAPRKAHIDGHKVPAWVAYGLQND